MNKHVLYSNILNRDVTLSIYLPESYNQLVKYNVILCFDGLDFLRFGRIQRTYESLIKEARIDDAIIVGFHYEDVDKRREEFHPQGSRSHLTIQSVGKEILLFIDSTFSTLKVGNARLLVGDSLAGSIALLTALTYPTIFSRVAMLSPHSDEKVLDKL
ncbi:alpha/beta hydrolase-fold protein, partial [Staphylococcus aureus]|nr:alpha/beta hydrolase-fold protein [Staphylococcus aureus]